MKISELIEGLEKIKEQYGDIECFGARDETIDYIKPQKCITILNSFYNEIEDRLEDLELNYLDKNYKDEILNKNIVAKLF